MASLPLAGSTIISVPGIAIVPSTNTAFVLLYQQQLKEKGYDYEYCSTLEKAMMLLNLPFTLHEMEHRLENLEERFVRNLNSNAS